MRGGCGVERSKLMHQQGKCSLLTASLQLDQGNYTLALFALSQVYLILKLHTCHISMVQLVHNPDARCLYSEFCIYYCLLLGSSALSSMEVRMNSAPTASCPLQDPIATIPIPPNFNTT